MARCQRCFACESMWDFAPCRHCNFPGPDKRTADRIKEDDDYRMEWEREELCDEEE